MEIVCAPISTQAQYISRYGLLAVQQQQRTYMEMETDGHQNVVEFGHNAQQPSHFVF